MICHSCETMYPDMCKDCYETVLAQIPQEFLDEDEKLYLQHRKTYVGSGEDVQLEMMEQ